jgi:hypothetical protein
MFIHDHYLLYTVNNTAGARSSVRKAGRMDQHGKRPHEGTLPKAGATGDAFTGPYCQHQPGFMMYEDGDKA